jgi:hypothetical protein
MLHSLALVFEASDPALSNTFTHLNLRLTESCSSLTNHWILLHIIQGVMFSKITHLFSEQFTARQTLADSFISGCPRE